MSAPIAPPKIWPDVVEQTGSRSVLVTFDKKMPTVHRQAISRRRSTLAVIDSKADRKGRTREEYTREVIHKWAHRMAAQSIGSRYKYSLSGRREIAA